MSRSAELRPEQLRFLNSIATSTPSAALGGMEATEASSARRGLDTVEALGSRGGFETVEASSLEEIAIAMVRPALLVERGQIKPSDIQSAVWSTIFSAQSARLAAIFPAVGRLDAPSPLSQSIGTAFLVGENLVMTARHAAESFALGLGTKDLAIRAGRKVSVDFGDGFISRVTEVVMIHPVLDVALLRIESAPHVPPLPLSDEEPAELIGRRIAVIGHPQPDARYESKLQEILLAGPPGGKRLMPGVVMPPQLYGRSLALTHDAITLGGRSGAPVIDLVTGKVVAVQCASKFLTANYAVPLNELLRDPQVANLLRSAPIVRASVPPWVDEWRDADGSSGAEAEPRPSAAPAVAATDAVIAQFEAAIARRFKDSHEFREFLLQNGHEDVVSAVPQRGGNKELVRALNRRGALHDSRFLRALDPVLAMDDDMEIAESTSTAQLSESLLQRLVEAAEPITRAWIDILAVGSEWRDYLLRQDDVEDGPATIRRLANDTRPDAARALAWLLQRASALPMLPVDSVKLFDEATQSLLQTTSSVGGQEQVAADSPHETPPMLSIEYLRRGMEAARSVVRVRVPTGGLSRHGGGTGWLLTPELVVVSEHVLGVRSAEDRQLDDGLIKERARVITVEFDADTPTSSLVSIEVASVAWTDANLDLAILRLRVPVLDRQPLRLRADPPASARLRLAMIHHALLGPKQISRGGRLIRHDGHDVIYAVDSAGGSGGAPVFDDEWSVVATHRALTHHRIDSAQSAITAKLGTATSALLARLRNHADVGRAIWREVVATQPALRYVDPLLKGRVTAMAEDDTLPVVVGLVDAQTSLDGLAGLRVDSSAYGVVTGVGNRQALIALMQHPLVHTLEVSRASASAECALSIPHIGAASIHLEPHGERGESALIAVIDNGVDVLHEAFRNEAGCTRIAAFWDQHDARAPAGSAQSAVGESDKGRALIQQFKLTYGALYVDDDIQAYIQGAALPATFPAAINMRHGTAVSSIAAGCVCGTTEERFGGGVAPAAALIVVRYDLQNASVGYSKGHVEALGFIDQLADRLNLPVVVNISNGMNAGAHDGTSLLETVCDKFTGNGKKPGRVVVKSAGNELGEGRHAMTTVLQGSVKDLRWRTQPTPGYGPTARPDVVELWFDSADQYSFRLHSPGGSVSPTVDASHRHREKCEEFLGNGNFVRIILTRHHDDNSDASLTVQVESGNAVEIEKGEWTLEITGVSVPRRQPIHAWLEWLPERRVHFQNYFRDEVTITIPGTAQHVISVGAVEVGTPMRAYEKSSWGPTRKGLEKPDIVAPGVGLHAAGADRGDLRTSKPDSGTSLAAPHVAGAIALALSACVKTGRPAHNSNRIRAALKETARHNTGWSPETGWGELDARTFFESLL